MFGSSKDSIPFFKSFSYVFKKIDGNIRSFFYLTCVVSLFTTLFSFVLGRNLLCSMNNTDGMFCSNNIFFVLFSILFYFVGVAYYVNRWFGIYESKKSLSEVLINKDYLKDFKTFLFVIFYLMLWGFLGFSIWFLQTRIVTENWKFELFLFVLISLGIMLSVVLLSNFMLFIRFLKGEKWWNLGKSLVIIFDNLYKFIGWFFLYLIIIMFLFRCALSPLSQTWNNFIIIRGLLVDFGYNFVVYLSVALIQLQFSYLEKEIFK